MDWQDISTAPKDGTEIAVWVPTTKPIRDKRKRVLACLFKGYWDDRREAWCEEGSEEIIEDLWERAPTHWQPLPSPPADDHGERKGEA